MSKYFLKSGYLNIDYIMKDKRPFIFILGGRGIGKTYGVTKWLCDNCTEDKKFIYMRRTEAEINFIDTGNIYQEHHDNVKLNTKSKITNVIKENEDNEEIIGYHLALSTIHNIRGFSMQDVSYILFDEFIAERGTVLRKFAGEQMLNAYETINRNRELNGIEPVKCIFLSNFNTAESDIMQAYGFTDEIYTYSQSNPIGVYQDEIKKLIMINENPISDKKSQTVLYQVSNDSNFKNMALKNDGSINIMPIKHYNRNAYDYIGTLGEVNINRLYSGYYYLTESKTPQEINKKSLLSYMGVYHSYLLGNVYTNKEYIAQKFVDYYQ